MREYIISMLLSLPIILLVISVHETAHGYVASKLGDPTAKSLGRLTLNPLKHIDPIGFICMILCGFGWAKPVPINTRYFKKPRRDMALTGAAGPVSNLLMAVVFTLLYRLAFGILSGIPFSDIRTYTIALYFLKFLNTGVVLNVAFAVFNLLPIPPFDGSRVFYSFLPPKFYFGVMKYEQYISLGLMFLLILGVLDPILSFFTDNIVSLLFRLIWF